MIKYFIIFILLFSNNVFSMESIKIIFENNNNNLKLYLINYGGEVLINKRFLIGPHYISYDVELEISDKKEKKYPFTLMIREDEVTEKYIVLLWAGDIIGKEYNTEILVSSYSLLPGQYKARAVYRNQVEHWGNKHVYNERLISDWVTFEITEKDMKNVYGENWRKVIQGALERKRILLKQRNE